MPVLIFRLNLFLFLLLLVTSSNLLFSQKINNSNSSQELFEKGDELLKAANYDSAIYYFTQAGELNKSNESWEEYLDCLNKISESNWRNGQLSKAREIAKRALQLNDSYLTSGNIQKANSYMQLGTINNIQGDSEKALKYYDNSWEIKKSLLATGHIELAFLSNNIGNVHLMRGEYDRAIDFYDQAIDVFKSQDTDFSLYLAHPLFNKGEILKDQGFYNQALKFHKEALALWQENLVEGHPLIGRAYIKIGQIHFRKGAFNLAYEYLNHAFNIYNEAYGEDHPFIGELYNSIGYVLYYRGEYDQALTYLTRALEIEEELYEDDHQNIANIHDNLGALYSSMGLYTKAIKHYNLAYNLLESGTSDMHPALTAYKSNLGNLYFDLDSLDKARTIYHEALEIGKKTHRANHPELSNIYYGLGAILYAQGKDHEVLELIQEALISNTLVFNSHDIFKNPDPEDCLDGEFMEDYMILKSKVFRKLWTKENNQEYLEATLACYQVIDQLIQQRRNLPSTLNDKINLNQSFRRFYEEAIDLNLKLFDLYQDSKYFDQAFYYAEKSRSSLLSLNLSDNNARKFSGLPEGLLTLEKSLKVDRSFFKSQIQEMKLSIDGYDTTTYNHYEKEVFITNRRLDSLITVMEREYPEYYQLKYKTDIISLVDFQKRLKSNEALLEYFDADNSYYVLIVTKEKISYQLLKKTKKLESDINHFRSLLTPESIMEDQAKTYNDYVSTAYNCYENLLRGPLSTLSSIDKLIIIQDGQLSYVPFEILVDQIPEGDEMDYKELPYLLKKFRISYSLMANLLHQETEKGNQLEKEDFMAFAPTYSNELTEATNELSSLGKFRSEVTSLDWNVPEVQGINNYFNGKIYTGKEAKERLFKSEVKNYRILHLAMHSLVDDQDPMNSRMVFTQDSDSIEDGFLNAYELYNMNIPADMVVLSACQTGYGKLARGEGVMSLGRAFSYAGCPSIVMSHWKVNDASTASLMDNFYKGLSDGQSKSEALRSAKLSYLNNTDKIFQHPYFWGSFVVIGDDSPIISTDAFWKSYTFWITVLALFIIGTFFYLKRWR